MSTTTAPTPSGAPSTTSMAAIDINTTIIQTAAAIAGAQALIAPFVRTDSAIQAAATLLHVSVGELQNLAAEIVEGIKS